MRTKALILTAMIGLAGVISSIAQNVYSVNVVGYINQTYTTEWSLVADQLDDGANNLVTNVFAATQTHYPVRFYKYNGATYDQLTRLTAAVWQYNPPAPAQTWATTVKPGEGIFVRKPAAAAALNYTFVGEVPQGDLVNQVTPGFEVYSAMVPQEGGIKTVHNFQPNRLDQVYYGFNGVTYIQKTWLGTAWSGTTPPGEPNIKVAEAFWINNRTNVVNNWTRTFYVNQ